MVGLIYCSGGFTSNFRSFRHRLTQFRLLTENRQLCATKSSAFSRKSETLQTKLQGFSSGFPQGNQVKKCARVSRKTSEEERIEKIAKQTQNGPKRGKIPPWPRVAGPRSPGDPGPRSPATLGPGAPVFAPGTPVFRRFSRFEAPDPWYFSKSTLLRHQNLEHPSKTWIKPQEYQNQQLIANWLAKKVCFLSDRSGNRQHRCHRPAASYQMTEVT